MRAHFKTGTGSFANSFLLLVIVTGVLHVDLFENDAVAGYKEPGALFPIELVFDSTYPAQSSVASVCKDVPAKDVVKDRSASPHFFTAYIPYPAVSILKKTGQAGVRSFRFSVHAHSFNTPHQNSDEDEAYALPVDAA